jgi:hypothetical protein
MATILIGYDLNSPGQDYAGLVDAIKNLGTGWWHHLDSTWLVNTSKTPAQVRDALAAHLDKGDEILVIDVTKASRAWRGFKPSGSEWLRKSYS